MIVLARVVTTIRLQREILEALRRRLKQDRIRAATLDLPNPTLTSLIESIIKQSLGVNVLEAFASSKDWISPK